MMSLWDALRMNMMISYQELVRTFLSAVEYCGADEYLYRGLVKKKLISCTIFANISIWEACLLRINT
ncbi:ydjO [Escherichia coli]|nr:ydjO [Escherichia coli]